MKLNDFRRKLEENSEYVDTANSLKIHFALANAVLKARLIKKWSQTDLAKAVGTKQANISRIESGLANPTLDLIQRLVEALDLEISIKPQSMTIGCSSIDVIVVPNWPVRESYSYHIGSYDASDKKGYSG